MNTFATLLLAFPFYLAVKGRLADYIALARPDASSSAANSQASNSSTGINAMSVGTAPASTTGGATSADLQNTANTVSSIFGDMAAAASLA